MLLAPKGQVEKVQVCDWCRRPAPPGLSTLDLIGRGWFVKNDLLVCEQHSGAKIGRHYQRIG
jgi:hypothetical protein